MSPCFLSSHWPKKIGKFLLEVSLGKDTNTSNHLTNQMQYGNYATSTANIAGDCHSFSVYLDRVYWVAKYLSGTYNLVYGCINFIVDTDFYG